MAKLDAIEHFVVLMLENRSFDNLLGALRPPSPGFDGIPPNASNTDWQGRSFTVTPTSDANVVTSLSVPDPDPGESWSDMNLQIYGKDQVDRSHNNHPKPGAIPNMSGFVQAYRNRRRVPRFPPGKRDPAQVMSYYQPHKHVPALAALADNFAVCDCWFASAPCQTWPNRFFLHTASAAGYENNAPEDVLERVTPSDMPTLFAALSKAGKGNDWRIYHHGVAQSFVIPQLFEKFRQNFHLFKKFREAAAAGELPSYSFIEPRYYADISLWPPFINLPNDQHSPHIVTFGDQLVAEVYNALRSNESAWRKTMLIIIYDEHGGCYDHASPCAAMEPGDKGKPWYNPDGPFDFDRFGVRVPAVIVSPYIAKGTVLRPSQDYPEDKTTPFDHTSVISTLCKRFGLGPLTNRDRAAPTLERVLTLDAPDNMGPQSIAGSSFDPGFMYRIKALFEPWGDFRQSLHDAMRHINQKTKGDRRVRLETRLQRHETGSNPDEDDGVRSDAGAIWAHMRYRALNAIGREN